MSRTGNIFISIGSNVDNRQKYLATALYEMSRRGVNLVQKSRIYETQPWGYTDQPLFLNQVAEVDTDIPPVELLRVLKTMEQAMGRQSRIRWAEREIDLDILYYMDQVIQTPELQIPHPQLHKRNFVLIPLCEIAPDFVDPVLGKAIRVLVAESTDEGQVNLFNPA